jgi:hypothetical protein
MPYSLSHGPTRVHTQDVSTTEDTVSVDPAVRQQPVLLSVLVAVVVVVGWVLYRHYVFSHVLQRVFRWHTLGNNLWVAELVQSLLLSIPFGLALVLWGRDLARSLGAAAVTLVTAVYLATLVYVFERHVFGDRGEGLNATSIRVFEWLSLLVVALLVPLAWGVARRTGRAWVVGVGVGPVVAAVLRELQLRWTWWRDRVTNLGTHTHWQYQAVVYVAPFVLAALACWAIEARGRRTPEIGSSA